MKGGNTNDRIIKYFIVKDFEWVLGFKIFPSITIHTQKFLIANFGEEHLLSIINLIEMVCVLGLATDSHAYLHD